MIVEFPVVQFWWLSHELLRLEGLVRDESGLLGGVVSSQPKEFDKGLAAEIKAVVDFAEPHCKNLEFQDTAMLPLWNIKAALQRVELLVGVPDPSADIRRDLAAFRKTIEMELQKRRFVYVSAEKSKYFAKEQIFGVEVYDAFPSARTDLAQAGDCLAISLPTACVFHLMRAAEHGLRQLARKMKVTLTHTGKSCPVEFADWEKIIAAIRDKITEARKLSAGPKRQEKLEAYSNAADHCEYMRDIWRNNLAHARREYIDTEAVAAYDRVRDFMIFLAKHL
jgi:hypothetical protein